MVFAWGFNDWPGLEGLDLAKQVTSNTPNSWNKGAWALNSNTNAPDYEHPTDLQSRPHVVAIDYGCKNAILSCLTHAGLRVTTVSATASFEEIMSHQPDGIFLSNGPGDPAATGTYALPVIKQLIDTNLPIFGICLGHQLLALAFGGKTYKMHQGHRGANHPVVELSTGKVEITSMNHGFSVDAESLPDTVTVSHISLFDKTVCGIEHTEKPIFSVQQHPEASPGPQDSQIFFTRFANTIKSHKA